MADAATVGPPHARVVSVHPSRSAKFGASWTAERSPAGRRSLGRWRRSACAGSDGVRGADGVCGAPSRAAARHRTPQIGRWLKSPSAAPVQALVLVV
jgi:hypothetical protein